jgi:predicted transcriptional regulator
MNTPQHRVRGLYQFHPQCPLRYKAIASTQCIAIMQYMKAIIEVCRKDSVFGAAREQITEAKRGRAPDYRLSFESARMLFAELTPARLDLLNTLRGMGPSSVYALAKAAGRNYSNVHADIVRLVELGLVERIDDETVTVPFDAVEIRMALAQAA